MCTPSGSTVYGGLHAGEGDFVGTGCLGTDWPGRRGEGTLRVPFTRGAPSDTCAEELPDEGAESLEATGTVALASGGGNVAAEGTDPDVASAVVVLRVSRTQRSPVSATAQAASTIARRPGARLRGRLAELSTEMLLTSPCVT